MDCPGETCIHALTAVFFKILMDGLAETRENANVALQSGNVFSCGRLILSAYWHSDKQIKYVVVGTVFPLEHMNPRVGPSRRGCSMTFAKKQSTSHAQNRVLMSTRFSRKHTDTQTNELLCRTLMDQTLQCEATQNLYISTCTEYQYFSKN